LFQGATWSEFTKIVDGLMIAKEAVNLLRSAA
jgi:hypothetical protein